MSNVLSLTTFLPILGVLLLLFIPKDSKGVLRNVTLAVTVVTFLVSLLILTGFQTNAEFQFVENVPWIAAGPFIMRYNIGIDGISLWLVILTTFIMPIAVLSTYTAVEEKVKDELYKQEALQKKDAMKDAFRMRGIAAVNSQDNPDRRPLFVAKVPQGLSFVDTFHGDIILL